MDREHQLKILAELYARIEDGEGDLHNITVEMDPFSGGLTIKVEGVVEKDLKSVAQGGQGIYQATTSQHTHTVTLPSPSKGQTILIKDAANPADNGIYEWQGGHSHSISPHTHTVVGSSAASVSLVSDGTDWKIISEDEEEEDQ